MSRKLWLRKFASFEFAFPTHGAKRAALFDGDGACVSIPDLPAFPARRVNSALLEATRSRGISARPAEQWKQIAPLRQFRRFPAQPKAIR